MTDDRSDARRKAAASKTEPRRRGVSPVGAFVPKVAAAAFEAHGFPSASILTDWPAIAGADLAGFTAPERLVWPRRVREHDEGDAEEQTAARGRHGRRSGATLVLRVDGPRAIEVQHATAQLIERVNTYFGYGAVAQLRILQGPVRRAARTRSKPPPEREARPDPQLDSIEDEGLRSALARLGARVVEPDSQD